MEPQTAASATVRIPIPIAAEHDDPPPIKADLNEALSYDETIKRFASVVRLGWYELGSAAMEIQKHELWKIFDPPEGEEVFHSFNDYINRRGQKCRASIYRGLQLREKLADVPENDCRVIPQQNAIWLMRLLDRAGKRKALTKEVIANATSMTEKDFSAFANGLLPGASHEEEKETISFSGCDKSLAKVVDEAITVAMWDVSLEEGNPVEDKRIALERLCAFYLDSKCEHEGFTRLSNREAFAKAHKRKPGRPKNVAA